MKILCVLLLICSSATAAEWQLVWSDEFDKAGLPDPSKWTYEEGRIRNQELQYYTARRAENTRIENGVLLIEGRREKHKDAEYTSGSITTQGKASWTYGRVEVRAKLPTGRGTWPAIWMLGTNIKEVDWPACGEIDIMENVGYDPDVIHANVHTKKYNHVDKTGKGDKITISKPYGDFHVYAMEWYADHMDFFVDSQKYFSFKNEKTGPAAWPFDMPFYLILNLAIGGAWGGTKGVDEGIFPQRMEVDYVRVYQRK